MSEVSSKNSELCAWGLPTKSSADVISGIRFPSSSSICGINIWELNATGSVYCKSKDILFVLCEGIFIFLEPSVSSNNRSDS